MQLCPISLPDFDPPGPGTLVNWFPCGDLGGGQRKLRWDLERICFVTLQKKITEGTKLTSRTEGIVGRSGTQTTNSQKAKLPGARPSAVLFQAPGTFRNARWGL